MNLIHVWPSAFQTAAFLLDAELSQSACEPFKGGNSIPYSPMILLDISPIGFQSQMFWGLSIWYKSQGLRCLIWDTDPSISGRNSIFVSSFIIVSHCTRGGFFFLVGPHLCLFYPSFYVVLLFFIVEELQLVYRSFLERIISYVPVDLLCHWRR